MSARRKCARAVKAKADDTVLDELLRAHQFMKKLTTIAAVLAVAFLIGCTSATATKTSKDGTQDSISVKAFLSTIHNGAYTSAGTNGPGITLTVTDSSPDQQAIATLADGVVKMGTLFAAKQTNAPAVVVTNNFLLPK